MCSGSLFKRENQLNLTKLHILSTLNISDVILKKNNYSIFEKKYQHVLVVILPKTSLLNVIDCYISIFIAMMNNFVTQFLLLLL